MPIRLKSEEPKPKRHAAPRGRFTPEEEERAMLEWAQKHPQKFERISRGLRALTLRTSRAQRKALRILKKYCSMGTREWCEYVQNHPLRDGRVLGQLLTAVGEMKKRRDVRARKRRASTQNRENIEKRYTRPGGSRDKKTKILEAWSSGKYETRDECADKEHGPLGVAWDTARDWLKGSPTPRRRI